MPGSTANELRQKLAVSITPHPAASRAAAAAMVQVSQSCLCVAFTVFLPSAPSYLISGGTQEALTAAWRHGIGQLPQ